MMDILNIENLFNYGAPFAVLVILLFTFVRPMIAQNKQSLETVTAVLQSALNQSLTACDERQTAYLNSLKSIEERHSKSLTHITDSHSEKLDALLETTSLLIQQNERISNDQNNILQAIKFKEDQRKLENEIVAIKEFIKGGTSGQQPTKSRL